MAALKLLNISADGNPSCMRPESFRAAVAQLGELTMMPGGDRMTPEEVAARVRSADIYITGHDTTPLPRLLADDPGRLRYICGITGTMHHLVPLALIEAGIPVTNWGDAAAQPIAESAMVLLLACLKDLHQRIAVIRANGWLLATDRHGGSLDGLNVGVYGCGFIGRRFVEMLRPFNPIVRVFDPYLADLPAGCERVDSLQALFDQSQAAVIHAGWTPETDKSVTADLLARLPDHGVIVNTARGGIIDQEALFAELATGRLRAGLDVLEPDHLPADHPARSWPNLILTAHQGWLGWPGGSPTLGRMHRYALDNLQRFIAGQPLQFVLTADRWHRST